MNVELPVDHRAVHEIGMNPEELLTLTIRCKRGASYGAVEMFNLDGGGNLFWRWDLPVTLRDPQADVFPAVIGSVQLPIPGYGNPAYSVGRRLYLISAGSPLLSFVRR